MELINNAIIKWLSSAIINEHSLIASHSPQLVSFTYYIVCHLKAKEINYNKWEHVICNTCNGHR